MKRFFLALLCLSSIGNWAFSQDAPACHTFFFSEEIATGALLKAETDGTAPFTYSWSTGDTSEQIMITEGGDYCVKVMDANGCESEYCDYISFTNSLDSLLIIDSLPECAVYIEYGFGGGELKAKKYSYEFDFGYYIDNPCIEVKAFEFEGDTLYAIEPTGAAHVTCPADMVSFYIKKDGEFVCNGIGFDGLDINPCPEGLIEAAANGTVITSLPEDPTEKLSFEWNTGQKTQTISPSEAGEYCVTMVNEATGCTNTSCIYYDPAWFIIDTCQAWIGMDEGEHTLFGNSEGVAPYTYSWSTGATTANIFIEEAGEFCVKITDATGCVSEACIYYDPNWYGPNDSTDFIDPIDCFTWIDFAAGGGILAHIENEVAGDYTYSWSTGEMTQNIFPKEAGEYCVIVMNPDSCVAETCIYYDPAWFVIDSCQATITITSDSINAVLTAESYGIAPYTYEWNTGTMTESIILEKAGEYCVKITDANGCISEACAYFDPYWYGPNDSTDVIDPIDCFTWIDFSASGGILAYIENEVAGDYTFEWSTGEMTQNIFPKEAGEYCVKVMNPDSCVTEACIYYDPSWFVIDSCQATITITSDSVNAILIAGSYGIAPYTYEWNTGATTESIKLEEAGDYCVVITDTNGCQSEACGYFDPSWVIIDPSDCAVIIDFGAYGGLHAYVEPWHILEDILGGDPEGNFEYNYLWNTGDTTGSIFPTEEGEYCVTITNDAGCEAVACTHYDPNWFIPDTCQTWIYVDSLGEGLTANSEGLAPYTYEWNTGETSASIEVAEAGDYCVVITDANGCQSETCIYFDPAWYEQKECYVFVDYSFDANGNINGLSAHTDDYGADYHFQWNTGENTQSIYPTEAGDYCVVITNSDGCESESCIYYDPAWFVIDSCYAWVNIGTEEADKLTLIAESEGQAPFAYEWSTGETTKEIMISEAGEYCVLVRDSIGCESRYCGYFDPSWYFGHGDCFVNIEIYDNTLHAIMLDTILDAKYEWSTGDTTQSIEITEDGDYCVVVVSENGCVAENCFFYSKDGIATDSIYNGTEGSSPNSDDIDLGDKPNISINNNIAEETAPISHAIIAPNPVSNNMKILLDLPKANKVNLNLFSIDGRSIINEAKDLNAGRQTINWDLSDLPSGAYFLKIQEAGKLTQTLKIIKTKL